MKKSQKQKELEEGLEEVEEEEEPQEEVVDDEVEDEPEEVEEPKELEPQASVQKGLVYQSAPEQHTLVDAQTGETIIYSNDLISFDRSIAMKTLDYARQAAINTSK